MDLSNIILKKEARIDFVTLNRPEVYNALNHALLTELGEVINQIRKDLGVGGVILFCPCSFGIAFTSRAYKAYRIDGSRSLQHSSEYSRGERKTV